MLKNWIQFSMLLPSESVSLVLPKSFGDLYNDVFVSRQTNQVKKRNYKINYHFLTNS